MGAVSSQPSRSKADARSGPRRGGNEVARRIGRRGEQAGHRERLDCVGARSKANLVAVARNPPGTRSIMAADTARAAFARLWQKQQLLRPRLKNFLPKADHAPLQRLPLVD